MSFTLDLWSLKYLHDIHVDVSVGSEKTGYGEIQTEDPCLRTTSILMKDEVKQVVEISLEYRVCIRQGSPGKQNL